MRKLVLAAFILSSVIAFADLELVGGRAKSGPCINAIRGRSTVSTFDGLILERLLNRINRVVDASEIHDDIMRLDPTRGLTEKNRKVSRRMWGVRKLVDADSRFEIWNFLDKGYALVDFQSIRFEWLHPHFGYNRGLQVVRYLNTDIRLTAKDLNLLVLLVSETNRVQPFDRLVQFLDVKEGSDARMFVRAAISRIRKALKVAFENFDAIQVGPQTGSYYWDWELAIPKSQADVLSP